MPKRSPEESFHQLVEQLLTGTLPQASGELQPLLEVAQELKLLARRDFKRALLTSLTENMKMSTAALSGVRAGFHTITPYLIVNQATELAEFMKQVFAAQERYRGIGSAGGFHIELQIGDSMLMVGGGGRSKSAPRPAALHVYVEDADAVYEAAIRSGATGLRPPQTQSYGDRDASVRDPYGNEWYIGTRQGENYRPEGYYTVTPYLHPRGAARMFDWVQTAFGAEEMIKHEADGIIRHATLKLGTSMLEMGEAHDEFQPMASALYLYVEDADKSFERAVKAGGAVLYPVADQPYGDRSGGIVDPFGNHWYISTHPGE